MFFSNRESRTSEEQTCKKDKHSRIFAKNKALSCIFSSFKQASDKQINKRKNIFDMHMCKKQKRTDKKDSENGKLEGDWVRVIRPIFLFVVARVMALSRIATDVGHCLKRIVADQGYKGDELLLRTMKLLYYANGIHFSLRGSLLFKDEFEHAPKGPKLCATDLPTYDHTTFNFEGFTPAFVAFISSVANQYKDLTTEELVDQTHNERPWMDTKDGELIDNGRLESFFASFKANVCERVWDDEKASMRTELEQSLENLDF